MSWIAFSRRHLVTAEPVHVHYVAEDSVAFLRAQFEAAGPEQTIRHRLLLRNLVQNGVRVQALLNTVSSRNHRMVLVTGMREPVARSISLLFFLADFYGHTKSRLSWRDGAHIEDLQRTFLGTWEQVFESKEPRDTFARVLRFYFMAYSFWFERELRSVLDLDVMGACFPPGPARRLITRGRTQVLVYRVEDMAPELQVTLCCAPMLRRLRVDQCRLSLSRMPRRSGTRAVFIARFCSSCAFLRRC